jgi:hypothetical protein
MSASLEGIHEAEQGGQSEDTSFTAQPRPGGRALKRNFALF